MVGLPRKVGRRSRDRSDCIRVRHGDDGYERAHPWKQPMQRWRSHRQGPRAAYSTRPTSAAPASRHSDFSHWLSIWWVGHDEACVSSCSRRACSASGVPRNTVHSATAQVEHIYYQLTSWKILCNEGGRGLARSGAVQLELGEELAKQPVERSPFGDGEGRHQAGLVGHVVGHSCVDDREALFRQYN